MNFTIRAMELSELRSIYKRITEDFAEGEYPPYDKLYKQLENNIQKGWILVKEGVDVAYSICAEGDNNYVLVSFLAVYREYRAKGLGTVFMESLVDFYSNAYGIIVEVEKIEDASDLEDKLVRERRIEFYKKAGFSLVPGIDYRIWDMPMHLMVFPCKAERTEINENIGKIIYDIYLALLGKQFIKKLEFKRI